MDRQAHLAICGFPIATRSCDLLHISTVEPFSKVGEHNFSLASTRRFCSHRGVSIALTSPRSSQSHAPLKIMKNSNLRGFSEPLVNNIETLNVERGVPPPPQGLEKCPSSTGPPSQGLTVSVSPPTPNDNAQVHKGLRRPS